MSHLFRHNFKLKGMVLMVLVTKLLIVGYLLDNCS